MAKYLIVHRMTFSKTNNGSVQLIPVSVMRKTTGSGGTSDILQPVNLFSTTEIQAPSTISFTISSTTYQAEEGMTWYEWANSEYNTGNFVCYGTNYSVTVVGFNAYIALIGPVNGSDTIQNNASYTIVSGGGGN